MNGEFRSGSFLGREDRFAWAKSCFPDRFVLLRSYGCKSRQIALRELRIEKLRMENFGRADSFAWEMGLVPDCITMAWDCYAHYIYAYAKSLPCDKEISLLGKMSRSDKRVAVFAEKGVSDS